MTLEKGAPDEQLVRRVAAELGLRTRQVQSTLEMLLAGATIPFITRYRKELTGELDEEEIRRISEIHERLVRLVERRQTILQTLGKLNLLTPERRARLESIWDPAELEDFYLPFRPRRKTRAGKALEAGLGVLAVPFWHLLGNPGDERDHYFREASAGVGLEKAVAAARQGFGTLTALFDDRFPSVAEAREGVVHILAAWLAELSDLRRFLRERLRRNGVLRAEWKDPRHPEAEKFRTYERFRESLSRLKPHQLLACNRGEKLGVLRLVVDFSGGEGEELVKHFLNLQQLRDNPVIGKAVHQAWNRLLHPALERELRREFTEKAWEHSYTVYQANLRQLLLQPPLRGAVVMGIDPGFRSGCKVAVVDATGKYLAGDTIYPHAPQLKRMEAKLKLMRLLEEYGVRHIAVGNGTASRETEELVAEMLAETGADAVYTIVSEAGASVYSVSPEARREFPQLEAPQRGNISIARRLLDPLAELVKIDPRALGVGQYQHDAEPRRLEEKLAQVVESVVNQVGVNLNTASAGLLARVSGLNTRTAGNIVRYRDEHGPFTGREELKRVPGIGESTFLLAAGFLRIPDGRDPLDNTGIHPETYPRVRELFKRFSLDPREPVLLGKRLREHSGEELEALAAELGLGLPTLRDIIQELLKPGRDPRSALSGPVFKKGVVELEQLQKGEILRGTVRNVVDFGAFVDIGVKEDGLIHLSRLGRKRVRHPLEVLQVGAEVEVEIIKVDVERRRIGLALRKVLQRDET